MTSKKQHVGDIETSSAPRPISLWHTSVLQPRQPRFPDLADQLLTEIGRLRPSKHGLTVAVIETEVKAASWFLEALYQAYFSHPRTVLALPLSQRFYSSTHPNPVRFPFWTIQRVVAAAQSLGWVKISKGVHRQDGSSVSTMEATGALATLYSCKSFAWTHFAPPPDDRLIFMADASPEKVRHSVRPDEGPEVSQWQVNLRRINNLLLSRCIYLDAPNSVILEAGVARSNKSSNAGSQSEGSLNFSRVTLRRIFARGRLDCGGRFYGGWWQHLPSHFRKYIAIDGYLTCEADYSGMALNCLYALEGKDIGVSDPYDIGLSYTSKHDPRRTIVKTYVNAMLNDKKGKYRLPHVEQRMLGITAKELRQRVAVRHAAVAHHFHTDIGLKLQYHDSVIAERVLLRFADDGEVCLPIHDSFIVRFDRIERLIQIMEEEFQAEFRRSIKVKPDELFLGERMLIPSHIPAGLSKNQLADLIDTHFRSCSIAVYYWASWAVATKPFGKIELDIGL